MTITNFENLIKSRRVRQRNKGSTLEYSYTLEGSDDEAALLYYLDSTVAPIAAGLILTEIALEQLGPETWEATITYGDPDDNKNKERPETGEMEWSFSTLGGTAHIELGIQNNVGYSAPGAPPIPATDNVIGLSNDGNGVQVEGVDILVPQSKFSETHYKPASQVDITYFDALSKLTGCTNDASFRGFDKGEVLFGGASGQRRGRGDWAVTYEFHVSKNKKNFQVGKINVAWKPGHEYLWVMYAPAVSSQSLIREAQYAFVSVPYQPGDFSQLGIGVS